jgi:hypothetical protein
LNKNAAFAIKPNSPGKPGNLIKKPKCLKNNRKVWI